MKKYLALFTALVGVALVATSLQAQNPQPPSATNAVPQQGVITAFSNQQKTYSAGFIGLVPPASATDTICLAGSSTKTVAIQLIQLSGSAGTLVSVPITMVRRASADTGGTAASTTANPANTIASNDSSNPTATATPISYTAVPTIGDSSPVYLRSQSVTFPVTSAGTSIAPLVWQFGSMVAQGNQAVILRGAAQQMCLNFNTISISSGVLNGSMEWTEF